MIVKTNREGQFFVAGNSNWRVAGPFASNDEAWAWIDANGFSDEHEHAQPPAPTKRYERQRRDNETVSVDCVLNLAPGMLSNPKINDDERQFIMDMQKRAAKRPNVLRSTDKQAAWWHRIAKRYGGAK
jgi:hypothetical protein